MNAIISDVSDNFPWLILLFFGIFFRHPLTNLASAISRKIDAADSFKIKSKIASMAVKCTADAKKLAQEQGTEFKFFGDPDQLKLMFKAQGSDWKKSTKALEVPGGCLIQMTTDRQGRDGTWTTAEALEFVPGVHVVSGADGEHKLESIVE